MPIDATQPYDPDNIFAKILRGEIPCREVYRDDHALAFEDINPVAPHHVLVIPTGAYVSWDDFAARASEAEIAGFVRAVGRLARTSAGMAGRKCRTSMSISSPASHWGRCLRGDFVATGLPRSSC